MRPSPFYIEIKEDIQIKDTKVRDAAIISVFVVFGLLALFFIIKSIKNGSLKRMCISIRDKICGWKNTFTTRYQSLKE